MHLGFAFCLRWYEYWEYSNLYLGTYVGTEWRVRDYSLRLRKLYSAEPGGMQVPKDCLTGKVCAKNDDGAKWVC